MARRRRSGVVSLALMAAAVIAVAACSDDPVAPAPSDVDVTFAAAGLALTIPPNGADSVDIACPEGGRLVVEGTNTLVEDPDSAIHQFNQTIQYDDCMFRFQNRDVTTNGSLLLVGQAHYGPQSIDTRRLLMSGMSTQGGTLSSTFDGETKTCGYNLSITIDTTTYEQDITGTVCNQPIDLTAPPVYS